MKEYSMADPPSRTAFPVARAGYPFLYASTFATAVFALLDITAVALLGLLATVSIALFFRDPDRMVPAEDALVVAPADGKVVAIERVDDSPFYEGSCTKVGIFMSVFNVHINRIPHEGTVTSVQRLPSPI